MRYSVVIEYDNGSTSDLSCNTREDVTAKIDELYAQIDAGWKFGDHVERITAWDTEKEEQLM